MENQTCKSPSVSTCWKNRKRNDSLSFDDELPSFEELVKFSLSNHLPQGLELCADSSSSASPATSSSSVQKLTERHNQLACELSPEIQLEIVSKAGYTRPPYSYTELIELAMKEQGLMTVRHIYDWISNHSDYYRCLDSRRWQPSVRHTLTVSGKFCKLSKTPKGHLWSLVPVGKRKPGPLPKKNHWKKQKIAEYQKTSYKKGKLPMTLPEPNINPDIKNKRLGKAQNQRHTTSNLGSKLLRSPKSSRKCGPEHGKNICGNEDNKANKRCGKKKSVVSHEMVEDPLDGSMLDTLAEASARVHKLLQTSREPSLGQGDGDHVGPYSPTSSSTDTCPSPKLLPGSPCHHTIKHTQLVPAPHSSQTNSSHLNVSEHNYCKQISVECPSEGSTTTECSSNDLTIDMDTLSTLQLADSVFDNCKSLVKDTMWNKGSSQFHSPLRPSLMPLLCGNVMDVTAPSLGDEFDIMVSSSTNPQIHVTKINSCNVNQTNKNTTRKSLTLAIPGQKFLLASETQKLITNMAVAKDSPQEKSGLATPVNCAFLPFSSVTPQRSSSSLQKKEVHQVRPAACIQLWSPELPQSSFPCKVHENTSSGRVAVLPPGGDEFQAVEGGCGLCSFCCPYCLPTLESNTHNTETREGTKI